MREGWFHNYMRRLWGKKIHPNSYSGYFWTLGRYDRACGPERPILGRVRYMSSANTARKLTVKGYLRKYGRPGA